MTRSIFFTVSHPHLHATEEEAYLVAKAPSEKYRQAGSSLAVLEEDEVEFNSITVGNEYRVGLRPESYKTRRRSGSVKLCFGRLMLTIRPSAVRTFRTH